jgi:hypothetical protein
MASFVKFESFVEGLAKKEHNLHTDTLMAYLTNTAPNAATHVNKADLTGDLSTANGYTAGGSDTTNAVSRSGGTVSVTGSDITWTSSGAGFGPFRYVVIYNDTHASDALVGYYDYTSSITPANGETFVVDMTTSWFTIA